MVLWNRCYFTLTLFLEFYCFFFV
uniref:Uncharacterized protein n=1 Tax=Anguilla anguilla TaxID=7936 RepID=A0A0E9UEJ5_ANGAN